MRYESYRKGHDKIINELFIYKCWDLGNIKWHDVGFLTSSKKTNTRIKDMVLPELITKLQYLIFHSNRLVSNLSGFRLCHPWVTEVEILEFFTKRCYCRHSFQGEKNLTVFKPLNLQRDRKKKANNCASLGTIRDGELLIRSKRNQLWLHCGYWPTRNE